MLSFSSFLSQYFEIVSVIFLFVFIIQQSLDLYVVFCRPPFVLLFFLFWSPEFSPVLHVLMGFVLFMLSDYMVSCCQITWFHVLVPCCDAVVKAMLYSSSLRFVGGSCLICLICIYLRILVSKAISISNDVRIVLQ
jgi:hypothetical protein